EHTVGLRFAEFILYNHLVVRYAVRMPVSRGFFSTAPRDVSHLLSRSCLIYRTERIECTHAEEDCGKPARNRRRPPLERAAREPPRRRHLHEDDGCAHPGDPAALVQPV